MIRLRGVTLARGPDLVLAGLDLEIRPGRVLWITGPNGAGKSTLLRVLAGVDPPRAGSVQREGPPLLYFQSEAALPRSATVGAWERLVRRAADRASPRGRTPLWPDVGPRRRIGRLSTGQRKRLLLDALFRRPGPMILDEPFEHLAPGAKAALRSLMEDRAREHVVVAATNQHTARVRRDGALHLEAGTATLLSPGEDTP